MGTTYYSEPIEKNTRYRAEYEESIAHFLEAEKVIARKQREDFISPKLYKANTEKYRQLLIEQLGFPLQSKNETPHLIEKTFVANDKNVNIYRMQFGFTNGIKGYGIYFEQVERSRNTPFIIGLHGGAGTPELVSSIHKDSANYNHLVRRMTDRGASVFVPQLLLWEKETYGGEYSREYVDGKLRQLGGSITALELFLMRGYLDYFIQEESINEDKLGIAGLSYGGMYALHFAAIETRIKACYSCSWVCDGFTYSWPDWSYKNAQRLFSVAETAALIAPRALSVAMGNKDSLFDSNLTQKECLRIKEFFRVFNVEEKFQSVIFDGVHELDKGEQELDFLFSYLLKESKESL